jgi:hypothetical protein
MAIKTEANCHSSDFVTLQASTCYRSCRAASYNRSRTPRSTSTRQHQHQRRRAVPADPRGRLHDGTGHQTNGETARPPPGDKRLGPTHCRGAHVPVLHGGEPATTRFILQAMSECANSTGPSHPTSATDPDAATSTTAALPPSTIAARNAPSVCRSDAMAAVSSSTYSPVAAGRVHVRRWSERPVAEAATYAARTEDATEARYLYPTGSTRRAAGSPWLSSRARDDGAARRAQRNSAPGGRMQARAARR